MANPENLKALPQPLPEDASPAGAASAAGNNYAEEPL